MRRARDLFRERRPDVEADGEMQGDAALSEDVRRTFLPDSTLSGAANVLICPNIDSANILFNVLKITGGQGVTVGPMLLGAAKPVHILTPSATVRRVVNMTALTVAAVREERTQGQQERSRAGRTRRAVAVVALRAGAGGARGRAPRPAPRRRRAGAQPSRPARKSSTAWWISAALFITNGPYCTIGSFSGRPAIEQRARRAVARGTQHDAVAGLVVGEDRHAAGRHRPSAAAGGVPRPPARRGRRRRRRCARPAARCAKRAPASRCRSR